MMDEDVSKLFEFVEQGDLERLKEMIEVKKRNDSILQDSVDKYGSTVLHCAAYRNHPSIIRWLLSSSEGGGRAAGFTNVLAKTDRGKTALHIAGARGHLECCQALVEGCNIDNGERAELLNAVGNEGWTALHYAAQYGHPSIIRWLLSSSEGGGRAAGFTNVLGRAEGGLTAMHLAILRGHMECCQALVKGCNIENGEREDLLNSVADGGLTVLHCATHEGYPSVIRWLLSSEGGGGRAAGFTKALARTEGGLTAMHVAMLNGHLECCQALVEGCNADNEERVKLLNSVGNEGLTALHYAADEGHPSVIKWLLSSEGGGRAAGFTMILARIKDGRNAMHLAAAAGHLECCQALVEGSNVENGERDELLNAMDNDGWTTLHYAAMGGHPSIIKWLLSSSDGGGRAAGFSSALAEANDGATAILFAAGRGYLECCQALVEGCNIENGERAALLNAADNDGQTAFLLAALNGRTSIIQWLLSSEEGGGRALGFSNVLAKTNKGETALHYAAMNGHLECCQALVEGSMIENGERAELLNAVADADEWTALHWAAQEGHTSIIRWLLSSEEGGGRTAGFTNILAKTIDGLTAAHIAAREGHLECCQALVEGSLVDNGERAELLNGTDEEGWTVLHWATRCGHFSMIRWLLSNEGGRAAGFTSSSITAKTSDVLSALHCVSKGGSVEAFDALLSGCTPAERLTLFLSVDKHGWTPLHIGTRFRNSDIIRELLLRHPETQTIVDARDQRGLTALHRAVIGGIDEESKEEWREGCDHDAFGNVNVIAALLTAPPKDDENNNQQAAIIDPNLGTKIE